MILRTTEIELETRGFADVIDLTGPITDFLESSGVTDGQLLVFSPGSTAGITTIEYESGAVADLKRALERMVPQDVEYEHDLRWGDGNGFSHVRAALVGPSLSIPLRDSRLGTGTWQQVVLCDFDNRPRSRRLTLQIVGQ